MKFLQQRAQDPVRFFLQIALPHADHFPALFFEKTKIFSLVGLIATDFVEPEAGAGLRNDEAFTLLMSMPETPVDENRRLVFGKNNVRPAGQLFIMKPVPEAVRVQKLPHDHLGLGVLALDL